MGDGQSRGPLPWMVSPADKPNIDKLIAERDQALADLAEVTELADGRLRELEILREPFVEELPGNDDAYEAPKDGWVCFHCGIRFKTKHAAAAHFGDKPTGRVACLAERDKAVAELVERARLSQKLFESFLVVVDVPGIVRPQIDEYLLSTEELIAKHTKPEAFTGCPQTPSAEGGEDG